MNHNFLTPGPVNVPRKVRAAMTIEPPYFASKSFGRLLNAIQPRLQWLFQTSQPVMIGTGSGTMGMEAAVKNFTNIGDRVLVITSGKYGNAWDSISQAYHGTRVTTIKVPQPAQLSDIERVYDELRLQLSDKKVYYKAVFMTHVETTTAFMLQPGIVKDIIEDCNSPALLILDAVSTLGVMSVTPDLYDVVVSASQKGLQCPPGLFFMSCSDKAIDRARRTIRSLYYFDVITELERVNKGQTSHTPAAHLFYPLYTALKEMCRRYPNVYELFEHCADLRSATLDTAKERRIPVWQTSPPVTAFKCFDQNAQAIQQSMKKNGWWVGTGVRGHEHDLIRTMHFGWDTSPDFIVEGIHLLADMFDDNRRVIVS